MNILDTEIAAPSATVPDPAQPALADTVAPVTLPVAVVESPFVAELRAENAALQAQVDQFTAKKKDEDLFQQRVRVKVLAGLSQKQAESAVRRQDDWDNSDYGKKCAARHALRQARANGADHSHA